MDYQCYKQHFLRYALQPANAIKSFSMSDDERVLRMSRSGDIYPQLQLDRPTYRPTIVQGGPHRKVYSGSVALLEPAEKDDVAGQEAILLRLESELDKLIAYLDYLRKAKDFRITNIGAAFPIKMYEQNNLWGWGIEIEFESKTSFCHDTSGDVTIRQLFPEFVDGQTNLALDIGVNSYSVLWTEKHLIARSLDALATAINEDQETTGIEARVQTDTLVLIHSTPGENIDVNAPIGGHIWDLAACDPIVSAPIVINSDLPIDLSPVLSEDDNNIIITGTDGKLYAVGSNIDLTPYMTKATYDANDDGVVDNASKVNGVDGAGNDKYYGTNDSGIPGFHDLPSGGGGGTPGGDDTQVQINNEGAFGGSASLTFEDDDDLKNRNLNLDGTIRSKNGIAIFQNSVANANPGEMLLKWFTFPNTRVSVEFYNGSSGGDERNLSFATPTIVNITSDVVVGGLDGDTYIVVDSSDGPVTITLGGYNEGNVKLNIFHYEGANPVTLSPQNLGFGDFDLVGKTNLALGEGAFCLYLPDEGSYGAGIWMCQ